MKSAVSSEHLAASWQNIFFFCLLLTAYCSLSCRVPNLDKPECTAAAQTVKEFYSFHFGNEMNFSQVNLKRREKFLTGDLKRQLVLQPDGASDYFTATDDYPKAFRIGECAVTNENKTVFQVVLFWRDDTRNEQREIKVEAVKENEKWLINKIF
ncbi:MAG: YbjP/YqhG family protein [Pyrinomonadaceae bacterium]|nr:YbjP/YqhG family protein [Pyrinomonadaceae bacterium]